jgi:hypothetical protein
MVSSSTTRLDALTTLHNRITKLFNNPNINFFIIMLLILIISCYTFINTPLKVAISSFVANPAIILSGLILVIATSFYNINIAILILLLMFIILYGSTIFVSKTKNNIEGFSNEDTEEDDTEEDTNNKPLSDKEFREFQEKETDKKIEKYKDIIVGPMKSLLKSAEKEKQNDILEDKKKLYNNLKNINKKNINKTNNKTNDTTSRQKENFQTIKLRKFDPTNEEDTNLLITKEILNDISNRITYNYETKEYLKKYIKHRVEEIVNINKLIDDDDE